MTLTKAIEAARLSLNCIRHEGVTHGWHSAALHSREALSTLPAKPMTEGEIEGLINKASDAHCGTIPYADLTRAIIRALKAAGVLYVAESGE